MHPIQTGHAMGRHNRPVKVEVYSGILCPLMLCREAEHRSGSGWVPTGCPNRDHPAQLRTVADEEPASGLTARKHMAKAEWIGPQAVSARIEHIKSGGARIGGQPGDAPSDQHIRHSSADQVRSRARVGSGDIGAAVPRLPHRNPQTSPTVRVLQQLDQEAGLDTSEVRPYWVGTSTPTLWSRTGSLPRNGPCPAFPR